MVIMDMAPRNCPLSGNLCVISFGVSLALDAILHAQNVAASPLILNIGIYEF
jgi:hypothetical protein